MPKLLSSIDDINPEWMTAVLAEAAFAPAVVRALQIEPIGAGNTGDTVKVSIDYLTSDKRAPSSVICKFHPADPTNIEAIKAAGVFLTEANAQRLLAQRSEAAIPECYWVAANDDGSQFNLVCEDLSARCELGDQVKGCSIEEARAAVLELAKMHRQFWNEPHLENLSWIRPRMPFPPNAFELIGARLSDLLSEEQYHVVRQATPLIHEWLELEPDNQTLIHVDCRVDNVLFDHRAPGVPKAYLIDFALVSCGDAVADVAYFLTSSVSPDDRLACELDLLEMHTRVIAEKDPRWTLDQATAAYRANIVSSLYLTMFAAMRMPDIPECNLLLSRLFERNCAAVQHWTNL